MGIRTPSPTASRCRHRNCNLTSLPVTAAPVTPAPVLVTPAPVTSAPTTLAPLNPVPAAPITPSFVLVSSSPNTITPSPTTPQRSLIDYCCTSFPLLTGSRTQQQGYIFRVNVLGTFYPENFTDPDPSAPHSSAITTSNSNTAADRNPSTVCRTVSEQLPPSASDSNQSKMSENTSMASSSDDEYPLSSIDSEASRSYYDNRDEEMVPEWSKKKKH